MGPSTSRSAAMIVSGPPSDAADFAQGGMDQHRIALGKADAAEVFTQAQPGRVAQRPAARA